MGEQSANRSQTTFGKEVQTVRKGLEHWRKKGQLRELWRTRRTGRIYTARKGLEHSRTNSKPKETVQSFLKELAQRNSASKRKGQPA